MQRTQCYNSCPTSISLCKRGFDDRNQLSFDLIDDAIFESKFDSFNLCGRQEIHEASKYNKAIPFQLSVKKNKHPMEIEGQKGEKAVLLTLQVKKPVYTSPLQSFVQQLLAEQNLTVIEVINDPMFFMLSHMQQQINGSIPAIQESYTSCSNDNNDHCECISKLESDEEDDETDHVKYIDLPPLIDIAHEMRTVM